MSENAGSLRDLVMSRSPFRWTLEKWAALWGTMLVPVFVLWFLVCVLGLTGPSSSLEAVASVAVLGVGTLGAHPILVGRLPLPTFVSL